MEQETDIGAIQWRIVIDRCPDYIRDMLFQHIHETKAALSRYPTGGIALLSSGKDARRVIPAVVNDINALRGKIQELELILESSVNMLTGYLNHIQEPVQTETGAVNKEKLPSEEEKAVGNVSLEQAFVDL